MNQLSFTRILATLALSLVSCYANAASFPDHPIRLVVGAPPGGGNDIIARLVARKMSENLGQQVFVDNRPGAGATIAADMVARAAPDGYTLMMTPSAHALAATIYPSLPYDAVKDFTAVGEIAKMPTVLIVNPGLPVRTYSELVALAKSKPGTLNFASGGNGTSQHLGGALLKDLAKIDIVHVPYKGSGPAAADLMSGQVQLMVDTLAAALPHIQSGKVRALFIATEKRSALLPDVPTAAEADLDNFNVEAWYGFLAPKNTPSDVIAKLNKALNKAILDPETRKSLEITGAVVSNGPPEQFMTLVSTEVDRWRPIILKADILKK